MRRFPSAARAAGWAGAALALALALRFLVIEPPEFAWTCQSLAPPWWCPLRTGIILALRVGAIGFAALAAGLLALWRGWHWAAVPALACGLAGLVLYVPEPAAGGVLLGALAMLRR